MNHQEQFIRSAGASVAALVLLAAAASSASAASHQAAQGAYGAHDIQLAQAATAAPASDMTDGEVRKVDKEAGKLTLKHAAIKNLDMPGMTMVFVVKDKAMLDTLKAGDKIKFKAIDDAGKFTVTELERAK